MSGRQFATLIALAAILATGCPTVDLGDHLAEPGSCRPDFAYYRDVLWPEYLVGSPATSCLTGSGCHGQSNDPRSALRLSTTAPVDRQANYEVATRFLSCSMEETSALLTKPQAGVDAHGGGDLFTNPSNERSVFLDWFYQ